MFKGGIVLTQKAQRLEFLDSIRGMACLFVLLSHSNIFAWPLPFWQFINVPLINIPFNGKSAVAMFFVLSGFVLSKSYFNSAPSEQPPQNIKLVSFYLRRFTRIWLPWFFAFGVSAIAQATVFKEWQTTPPQIDWVRDFWHVPLTFENTIKQCLFIIHDPKIQLLNQDWSLGIELKASILLPLFILLAKRWSSWSLLVIAVVWLVFSKMGGRYGSFILGVLLAKHLVSLQQNLQFKPFPFKVALLVSGILLYEAFHFVVGWLGCPGGANYAWMITSVGCVIIILSSICSRRIQALLHLPIFIFLGRISYSVYLLQFLVILCILPAWVHCLNQWGIYQPFWLVPLNLMASIILTVAFSIVNYYWVEKPCINLGHWLVQKYKGKSS